MIEPPDGARPDGCDGASSTTRTTPFSSSMSSFAPRAFGPPMVLLSDLIRLVSGRTPDLYPDTYALEWPTVIPWAHIALWLVPLCCCFVARLHRAGRGWSLALLLSLPAAATLFLLYAAALNSIGFWTWDYIERVTDW
jgi:hypothetical protein